MEEFDVRRNHRCPLLDPNAQVVGVFGSKSHR
jgi:hypothetical protein